jgi:hypothetical protein
MKAVRTRKPSDFVKKKEGIFLGNIEESWRARRDLNPQPSDPKFVQKHTNTDHSIIQLGFIGFFSIHVTACHVVFHNGMETSWKHFLDRRGIEMGKHGGGRPSKLLQAGVAERILKDVRDGAYIKTACVAAGITEPTFYNWLNC